MKYKIWWPYQGSTEDDARTIGADSPRAAVTKWAELEDARGDYTIVNGSDALVNVRTPEGELLQFVAHGEHEPVYTAREACAVPAPRQGYGCCLREKGHRGAHEADHGFSFDVDCNGRGAQGGAT